MTLNCLGSVHELHEGPHPYHSEINHDDTIVLLCYRCYQEAQDDI